FGERLGIQQITTHRLDTPSSQLSLQGRRRRSRHADDTPFHSRDLRSLFRHSSQGWPHLPTYAEHQNVAIEYAHGADCPFTGFAEKVFQLRNIPDGGAIALHTDSLSFAL